MRSKGSSTIHRRDFLGSLMATGAIGLSALAPFRLNAMQEMGQGGPTGAELDQWLGRMRGKHRQVFDSPHNLGGMPFAWTRVFLMTNASVGRG